MIAAALKEEGISAIVCVATEYGESLVDAGGAIEVRTGRLNKREMEKLIRTEAPRLVMDATHPYAVNASRSIMEACHDAGVKYCRVVRDSERADDVFLFNDMDSLIDWLQKERGTVFSSLGSKEAGALTALAGFEDRLWLRILPSEKGLADCISAGFPPAHIICMQGPFSKELNEAMFKAAGADILITKESGRAGGFIEKLEAARAVGMKIAVLARPEDFSGMTVWECIRLIKEGDL